MGNTQSELGNPQSQEYVFMQSIITGDVGRVRTLLSQNPDLIQSQSKDHQTAWHYAAQGGQLQILQLLHQDPGVAARRAMAGKSSWPLEGTGRLSIDYQSKKGQTPLMLACDNGHAACVAFLLEKERSDAWVADLQGSCAIHYAALKGQAACLQALLAKPQPHPSGNPKAKYVNVRNQAGMTPLHCAAYCGHAEAASVLLAAGCRLAPQTAVDTLEHEVACNRGSTPLHLAAMRGHPELVRVLMATYVKILEDGQDGSQAGIACPDPRSITDHYGLTPHLIATKWGRDNVAPLLDPMLPLDISPKSPKKPPTEDRSPTGQASPTGTATPAPAAPRATPDAPSSARPAGATASISLAAPGSSKAAAAGAAAAAAAGGQKRASEAQGGGTTAWMSEILDRVVPESANAISLPSRSVADAGGSDSEAEVPCEYLCPISKKLMCEPVIAADGCTYDKGALQEWVAKGATTYPDGSCAIDANMVLPNTLLRAQINQWKRQHPDLAAQHL